MSRRLLITVALVAALFVPMQGAATLLSTRDAGEPVDDVDPFIGTLGGGFVFPGAVAPHGMVQLSPDTEGYFAYTGYQRADRFIRGFSHVHISGMGVPAGGNLPVMPTVGPPNSDVFDYQSPFNPASEHAEPGFYRVRLDRSGIIAELSAGTRVGLHRYTFPPSGQANVLFDVGRHIPGGELSAAQRAPGTYPAEVRLLDDGRTVVGTANTTQAGPHHYAVHLAARFDRQPVAFGTWDARGGEVDEGAAEVAGDGAGAYATFDTTTDRQVRVKVGISFVSVEGALANLDAELPDDDFNVEALRASTRRQWNDALSAIEVDGGTVADRRSFRTALYHAQLHPNVFHDVTGQYRGHDGEVHRTGAPGDPMPRGSTYYANFSLWDTYRGHKQLLALIAPERFADMVRSLGAIAEQGERLPRWAMAYRSPDYMMGEPALAVIADAACRGLLPRRELQGLYDAAAHVTFDAHRQERYHELGYIPVEDSNRSASETQEHALTDFSLALVADALGRVRDRDRLLDAAGRWGNVFDDEVRFMRPRHADGSFVSPWRPETEEGFQEGTGWQYTWLVPHDVRGLFDRIGAPPQDGDDAVVDRLDVFFSTPLTGTLPLVTPEVQQKITLYGIAYFGNQFPPSNQHVLHSPYLYHWAGQPWKTQAIMRGYQGLYRPTSDGIPGNDDLGSLSAWYAWSALGLYPPIAGAPLYTLASPVFNEARVRLPDGGVFTIEAPGASLAAKYVQSATLDGEPLDRAWFTHDRIAGDSTLRLDMGLLPNRDLGAHRDAAPPSLTSHDLADFGCQLAEPVRTP